MVVLRSALEVVNRCGLWLDVRCSTDAFAARGDPGSRREEIVGAVCVCSRFICLTSEVGFVSLLLFFFSSCYANDDWSWLWLWLYHCSSFGFNHVGRVCLCLHLCVLDVFCSCLAISRSLPAVACRYPCDGATLKTSACAHYVAGIPSWRGGNMQPPPMACAGGLPVVKMSIYNRGGWVVAGWSVGVSSKREMRDGGERGSSSAIAPCWCLPQGWSVKNSLGVWGGKYV